MRVAALLLVIANVALFVFARYDRAAQSETERLSRQVEPERIRLLSPQQVAEVVPAKAATMPEVCLEWGPFADADRARAESDLAPLALGRLVSQRPIAEGAYWVNVGPIATRAAADKRASELRAQGVSDLSVVEFGRGQFTVSLGVFRTEAAALARAQTLAARGLPDAHVEPRQPAGTQAMIVVRDPPQPVVARLKELQGQYAGTDLKVAACPS